MHMKQPHFPPHTSTLLIVRGSSEVGLISITLETDTHTHTQTTPTLVPAGCWGSCRYGPAGCPHPGEPGRCKAWQRCWMGSSRHPPLHRLSGSHTQTSENSRGSEEVCKETQRSRQWGLLKNKKTKTNAKSCIQHLRTSHTHCKCTCKDWLATS